MSFNCDFKDCLKSFACKQSLYRHKKNDHQIEIKDKTISCSLCGEKFHYINQLIDHVQTKHEIKIDEEKHHFNDEKSFLNWKESVELQNYSKYVKVCGSSKSQSGSKTTYFYCHRSKSADLKSTKDRKIALKSQGTCKIDNYCTSMIVLNDSNGLLSVRFVKTHFNHELEAKHLTKTKFEKMMIAKELHNGLDPYSVYLKLVKENKIKNLTTKDIANVQNQFNINKLERLDKDDFVSIKNRIDEVNNDMENGLNFNYKPIGQINNQFPGLEKNDFFLFMMNQFQVDQLVKCLNGKFKIISCDSTHKTNQYGYKLITAMVIDEFHEGIAVAFCISNKEIYTAIKLFFKMIKERCKVDLKPEYFMSDDDPVYYSAFVSVFGHCKKLLCAWHVDRSWKEKLKEVPIIKRKEVYKYLKALQIELDQKKFEKMKTNLYEKLMADKDTKNFGAYLNKNYFNRCSSWAYCFRLEAGINTNIFNESFHKRFKRGILKGKVNRRLDSLINSLEKYLLLIEYEIMVKSNKGKTSKKLRSIFNNHKKAMANEEEFILEEANDDSVDFLQIFTIKNTKNSKVYQLRNKKIQENHLCRFYCKDCNVCTCKMSCTCMRYTIYNELCKHIHFLCLNKQINYEFKNLSLPNNLNDQLMDLNDQLIESNDQLMDSNDQLMDSNDQLMDLNDQLIESNLYLNINKLVCSLELLDFSKKKSEANKIVCECLEKIDKLDLNPKVNNILYKKRKQESQVRREPNKKSKKTQVLTRPNLTDITNIYKEIGLD